MKKILIVDDSAFMRTILKDLLVSEVDGESLTTAVELSEADSKVNALKIFQKFKPDVILLDIVMQDSETEGLEFLEEIKDIFDMNKVIMISSIRQTSVLDKCKKYGVTSYLQKPFEHNQVIKAVNRALA